MIDALPLFLPSTTSPLRPVSAGCVPNMASGSLITRSTPMPDSRVKLRAPRMGLFTAMGRSLMRLTSAPSSGSLAKL